MRLKNPARGALIAVKTEVVATDRALAPAKPLLKATPKPPAQVKATTQTAATLSDEERKRRIAAMAYERALRLGFGRTNPVEDWLWAEREVDTTLALKAG